MLVEYAEIFLVNDKNQGVRTVSIAQLEPRRKGDGGQEDITRDGKSEKGGQ